MTDTDTIAYCQEQLATIEKQRGHAEQQIATLQALINGLNYARTAYTDVIAEIRRRQEEELARPEIRPATQEEIDRISGLKIDPAAELEPAGPLARAEEALAAAERLMRPPLQRPLLQPAGIESAPGYMGAMPPELWQRLASAREDGS